MASTPTADTDAATAALDGRLARSARTRLAIIEALRALNHDGDLRPTASRVADRAGVSLRTVWQHFNDFERLLLEAARHDYDIVMAKITPIDAEQPFAQRLQQFVRQRADVFEAVAPVWRAGRLHEPFSPAMRANRDRLLAAAREQLQQVFASELAAMRPAERAVVTDALLATSSWATWETWRGELGLSLPAARRALHTVLAALLTRGNIRAVSC